MNILVVDDDETLRLSLRFILEEHRHCVWEACDGKDALEKVQEYDFDLIFLDVNMPHLDGIETLKHIKKIEPQVFCVVLTAYCNVKDAVKAIKFGAYDYIEKPVTIEHVDSILSAAKKAKDLVKQMAFSAPQVRFAEGRMMIGNSSQIVKVYEMINKISEVDTSVLIQGESGTGKELVARAIHFNSKRKKRPFIAVNCAAIPESLIESEFFGHEKGAFTGAETKNIGKIRQAEGGSLFLDEIGDISLSMQVKLLRVLQEKTFLPLGSQKEEKADVRIIAAGNKDLESMVKAGTFRLDFFYRINIIPIVLPALRERLEDLEALVHFIIDKYNKVYPNKTKGISSAALKLLQNYSWPGNIRELENVIERAFILEEDKMISVASLPCHIINLQSKSQNLNLNTQVSKKLQSSNETITIAEEKKDLSLSFADEKKRFEKTFLRRALQLFGGRINKTAEKTQMTKVTLLRKIQKYKINPNEFKKQ